MDGVTRIYAMPHKELPDLTPRQVELLSIRHRIATIASMLTSSTARVEWAVGELEREVERLKALGGK